MPRVLRSLVVAGLLVPLLVGGARAGLLSAQVVAINDVPIMPTDHVTIAPEDSVTIDMFVAGWNEDIAGSRLQTYQIGIDGVTSYHSGSFGRLVPRGWDAVWPALCSQPDQCPAETPFCNVGFGTCACINGQNSCPTGHATCFSGLCVGSNHDLSQATFIDEARTDYVYRDVERIAAVRQPRNDLQTLLGGTPLAGNGPLDAGQTMYAGTHVLHASADACGTFTLVFESTERDTFFLLDLPESPGTFTSVAPSVQTVTIDVDPGDPCPALLISSSPIEGSTLSRTHGNAVRLRFDRDVVLPTADQLSIVELTSEVCAGSPGDNLFGLFQFDIDGVDPSTLTIRDSSVGTLRHGTWYRIANAGAWPGVAPFAIDFLAMFGDANGDGFVSFTDLAVIHEHIPAVGGAETNTRFDINADDFINFTDLSVAFSYIPTFRVPHPCP